MRPGEMPLASKPLMMADAMAPAPMNPMFRLCKGEAAVMALIFVQRCWIAVCGYPEAAIEFLAAPIFCERCRVGALAGWRQMQCVQLVLSKASAC